MPYAHNGKVSIYYETQGEGQPLILIHGYLGSIRTWKMTGYLREFSKNFKVIALDTRGYGMSSKPHQIIDYAIEEKVRDIAAVLDQEGIERTNLLGFSGGGRIVYAVTKLLPKRVNKAVVGGMSPYLIPDAFDMQERVRCLEMSMEAVVDNFESLYGKLQAKTRDFLLQNDNKAILADTLATMEFEGFAGDLMYFDSPYLLYVGTKDPFYQDMIRASKEIPNCKLEILDGMNHYETLTRFKKVVPVVEKFLLS